MAGLIRIQFPSPNFAVAFLAVGGSFYVALLPLHALPVMMRVIFFCCCSGVSFFSGLGPEEELGPLLVPWQGLRRFAVGGLQR